MNKFVLVLATISLAFTSYPAENLSSARWGQNGHRTVGLVAEHHLSPKAAKEVKRVLGHQSLAEVSTWMDEIKSDDRYDYMSPWHYVFIPEGKTYDEIEKAEGGDIIRALNKVIDELKTGDLDAEKEAENLKILVHLIGDLHQPLHVNSKDDRGGNNVRLQWFWDNSNLHRVWDTEMIEDKNLSFTELARFVNHPTKDQISQWQQGSILDWAYGVQKFHPQIYDLPEDLELSYEYSYKNWDTVKRQLLVAGVRLAGVINDIYS